MTNLKDTVKAQHFTQEQHSAKIREIQDNVFKLDSVQMPAINTRLNQLVTKEELNTVKVDLDDKVKKIYLNKENKF